MEVSRGYREILGSSLDDFIFQATIRLANIYLRVICEMLKIT